MNSSIRSATQNIAVVAVATISLGTGVCTQAGAAEAGAGAKSAAIQASLTQEKRFDINSQPLASALKQFANQAGLQIMFSPDMVAGRMAPEVRGQQSSSKALQLLLQGTGLEYAVEGTTIAVRAIGRTGATPHASSAVAEDTGVQDAANNAFKLLADASMAVTADEALLAADTDKGSASKKSRKSSDDVEEMIVEENRIKPFADANVDVPRTVNDVQPYYIFDSETIERSAALNVEDFLKQRLTMNATGQTFSQISGAAGSGTPQPAPNLNGSTSGINLRGVGMDKTLVLVNGRRLAHSSLSMATASASLTSGQADLNGIPLSAIERIEVMPSSSSGIYGGSALGGVVNVVLKKNYTGGEAKVSYDNATDTNSPRRTASLSYGSGFNGGKTRMMVSASWTDSEAMLLQDRRELIDRGLATIFKNNPSFIYSNSFLGALPNIQSSYDIVYNPDGSWASFSDDPGVLTLKNGTSLGSRITYIPAGTSASTPIGQLASDLLANANKWIFDLPPTAQNPTGLGRQMGRSITAKSIMLTLSHQLTPRLEMTLDLARNQNDSLLILPPNSFDSVHVSSANPFNPFSTGVSISLPNTLVYEAPSDSTTDSATLGMTMQLPAGWRMQGDYTWSRNSHSAANAFVDFSLSDRIDRLAVMNPFVDALANPLDLTPYIARQLYDFESSSDDIAIRGSGPLPSLPWGTPSLTVGLERRVGTTPQNVRLANEYRFAENYNSLQVSYARKQIAESLYAEALIPLVRRDRAPLLRSLDLQISGRTERYVVDTGTPSASTNLLTGVVSYTSPTRNGLPFFAQDTYVSTNHTIGFKYQPLSSVTLRTSMATAFVPPTPAQLLKNPLPNTGLTTVTDPLRNNTQFQVQTISGGNPELQPQNSESFNVGLIFEPAAGVFKGTRFNAEYYRITQRDVIGSLSAQLLLNDERIFSNRIVRNAAGNVVFIDTSMLNLYGRETEGMDLSADYSRRTDIGTLGIRAVGSMILGLKDQYSLTLPEYDNVGFPSEGGAAKYKSNMQLSWDYRNWSAAWSSTYFGSYKQNGAPGGRSAIQRRATNPNAALDTTYTAAQGGDTIPSQLYHDIYIGYAFDKSVSHATLLSGTALQLGVRNIFNTLPPVDVYYDYYISPYGDTRLRTYWLSVKKSF